MIKTNPLYHPLYNDKDKFIILVTGGRSSGKALPLNEVVLTPCGYKPVIELKKGDAICSVGGGEQYVTELHPIEKRRYVRLCFDDGTKIECSREHLWEVFVDGEREVLEAQELKGGESVRLGEATRYSYEDRKTAAVVNYHYENDKPIMLKESPTHYECQLYREQGRFVREFSFNGKRYAYISFARKYKNIVKVEDAGEVVGRCISVSDESGLFFTKNCTITHNSFSLATFIERLTFETGKDEEGNMIPHVILYARYTMTSAEVSIIPEFREKIEMDGTSKYFKVTNRDIINLSTGSRIMFRGIHTSSGNQTAKLKSIQGLTTLVVDEAEEWVNETEFDTIMYSIRKKGIQNRVIIIMNPTNSNHFIYQRYIKDTHKLVNINGTDVQISTHPNVLHIHTSYLQNTEHCGEEFLREMDELKERDEEKYGHIAMGRWSDVAEGAVFKKYGFAKEFPHNATKVALGTDWGYSNDVTAMVKCGIVGNTLYMEEKEYRTHLTNSELIHKFREIGLHVYADSADPRLINEMSLGGVIINAVQKGGGSIMAGIEKMLDMDLVIVGDSPNLKEEFKNYTWDKDSNGNYINQPIDAYNHACFVGDTLITTSKGMVRIENIKKGDVILNSDGWHGVEERFYNGIREVYDYTINTSNGNIHVTCTSYHKVKTIYGFKEISEITKGDIVYLSYGKTYAMPSYVESVYSRNKRMENVFDLKIESVHEYYANGLLVHNCDAVRYYVLAVLLGKVMQPRRVTKSSLGIY